MLPESKAPEPGLLKAVSAGIADWLTTESAAAAWGVSSVISWGVSAAAALLLAGGELTWGLGLWLNLAYGLTLPILAIVSSLRTRGLRALEAAAARKALEAARADAELAEAFAELEDTLADRREWELL